MEEQRANNTPPGRRWWNGRNVPATAERGEEREKRDAWRDASDGGGDAASDGKVSIPDFGRYYLFFFLPVTRMIDLYICYFWLS